MACAWVSVVIKTWGARASVWECCYWISFIFYHIMPKVYKGRKADPRSAVFKTFCEFQGLSWEPDGSLMLTTKRPVGFSKSKEQKHSQTLSLVTNNMGCVLNDTTAWLNRTLPLMHQSKSRRSEKDQLRERQRKQTVLNKCFSWPLLFCWKDNTISKKDAMLCKMIIKTEWDTLHTM